MRATPRGLRASALQVDDSSLVVFSFPIDQVSSASATVGSTEDPMTPLTAAEREVMILVLDGLSSAEIALQRGRSVGTINKQIERSYRKLGLSSRAELAARYGDPSRR
jgi:DNA-binding CsgD family transcriptional regulator